MRRERGVPVYQGEPLNYTQAELEAKALKFIKENKPREYRKMKALRELSEYCQLKAERARKQAESLIADGIWDKEAWNLAIRQVILESESD